MYWTYVHNPAILRVGFDQVPGAATMDGPKRPTARGRGSPIEPPNRFGGTYHEIDLSLVEDDAEYLDSLTRRATEYLPDRSRSIVAENQSPDVGFRYSINPYRGCMHGCSYCYARPTHEYLGLNAGLDFESKILVKEDAPRLFREFLQRPRWTPEPIALSGVTDCYQPAERRYRLTRGCLETALECRQPMTIITKNGLITRDLDVLSEMARHRLVHAYLSVTTLDPELSREMEPRTSLPAIRLRAIRSLAEAGVPVGVMVAPVVPGLTEPEIPAILRAAHEAGARVAGHILLRLPLAVAPIFEEWLRRTRPGMAERVLNRVRQARGGRLNSSRFGERMRGDGELADQVAKLFRVFAARLGYEPDLPPLDTSAFRPPLASNGQLELF